MKFYYVHKDRLFQGIWRREGQLDLKFRAKNLVSCGVINGLCHSVFRPSGAEHNREFFTFRWRKRMLLNRNTAQGEEPWAHLVGFPCSWGSQAVGRISEQACGSNRRTTCWHSEFEERFSEVKRDISADTWQVTVGSWGKAGGAVLPARMAAVGGGDWLSCSPVTQMRQPFCQRRLAWCPGKKMLASRSRRSGFSSLPFLVES